MLGTSLAADPHEAPYWDARCRLYAHDPQRMVGYHDVALEEQTALLLPILQAIVKPGFRVLDVACGYGRLAEPIIGMGASWTGIDFSPAMRELWQSRGSLGAFHIQDAREGAAGVGGGFDVVMCCGAPWLTKRRSAFRRLWESAVKRTGCLVTADARTVTVMRRDGCHA